MFEVPNNVSQARSFTIMIEEIPQHMQNKSLLRKWYLTSTSNHIYQRKPHTHRERESRAEQRTTSCTNKEIYCKV